MTKVSFGRIFGASLLANVTILGVGVIFVAILLVSLIALGPDGPEVRANSILKLRLQGQISEQTPMDGLADFIPDKDRVKKMGLFDLIKGIDHATTDQKVKAVYIEISNVQAGVATLEELRSALVKFKQSGKKVYVYSEGYRLGSYYLASVADRVWLYPEGMNNVAGVQAKIMYLEELLTSWGVEVDVVRHGAFKSAGETFTRNSMSDENRIQIRQYLEAIWGHMGPIIAESRGVELTALDEVLERAFQLPSEMLAAGLVDSLIYENNLNETVEKELDGALFNFSDYVSQVADDKGDEIAVVYVDGSIPHGKGGQSDVPVSDVVDALNSARDNQKIKAVVLRVNSPGGSALYSDKMWRAAQELKVIKPLIVSMGDVAASGGYYVSAPADLIFVNDMTLTGSIGVFSILANAEKLIKDKWHLNFDSVATHSSADIGSITRAVTPKERQVVQQTVDAIYESFVDKVAAGRRLSVMQVDELGGGRIWGGRDAVANGLADHFGGLTIAIDSAAGRAGVERFYIETYPKGDPFEEMLSGITNASSVLESISLDGGIEQVHHELTQWKSPQTRIPFVLKDW